MKNYWLLILAVGCFSTGFSQGKYFTKTAKITFNSKAPGENIEAKNNTGLAVMDTKTGGIQFAVQMQSFQFEKALMRQHFNEDYVESSKYPKAGFKGMISNNKEINYHKNGTYPAKVKGRLTIHGITRDIESAGTLKVSNGKIFIKSGFNVLLSDYDISIPSLVKDKVSNSVNITVDAMMEPLK